MNIQKIDQIYVANTYARFPLTLVRGSGSLVYDDGGQEYIDLGTGIAVNAFGVCDREWSEAVQAQLLKIQHTSNLFYNEPCALLAEQLCLRTGMKKVFFSNSGAEANECAIKAAREYGERKKGVGYSTIITLRNSFHGRTLTTLAATGQEVFHEHFTPLTPGFVHAYANDMEDVERLVGEHKCCAVMFEVVQGEGGVIALDREFLTELSALAQKEDLLLIADEVQIGNGRSGMLYGYMNYGIKPDIFTRIADIHAVSKYRHRSSPARNTTFMCRSINTRCHAAYHSNAKLCKCLCEAVRNRPSIAGTSSCPHHGNCRFICAQKLSFAI